MKAQSIILQFLLFFIIGFSIFLATTAWYQTRKISFQDYTSELERKSVSDFLRFYILETCLTQADYLEKNITFPNTTNSYFYTISLENNKIIKTVFFPQGKSYQSDLMGLNYSYIFRNTKGPVASTQKLILIKNKNQINITGD
jgi:hypothetical protein